MYDLQGREVEIDIQSLDKQWVQIQGKVSLPEGLYLVRIRQTDGTVRQRKVVVKRRQEGF